MCKSVVHVSSDEKHLQAFITSALSTPSSSSEYDRAYIPPTPPPKKQKQKNKKTKKTQTTGLTSNETKTTTKTASDCYRSTSHNLDL